MFVFMLLLLIVGSSVYLLVKLIFSIAYKEELSPLAVSKRSLEQKISLISDSSLNNPSFHYYANYPSGSPIIYPNPHQSKLAYFKGPRFFLKKYFPSSTSLLKKATSFLTPLSQKNEVNLQKKLERANLNLSPQTWQGIVLLTSAFCALLCLLVSFLIVGPGFITFLISITGLLIGWFMTRKFLDYRIKTYRNSVEQSLPNAIELLSITVSSGLTIQEGMKIVASNKRQIGAAAQEFYKVGQEIDYLGLSFEEAINNLSERMQSQVVASFVSAVIHGAEGSGIKRTLILQAQESRALHQDTLKEQIAKMDVKLTIPLTLFFLPSILCFVLLPTILQILSFVRGM